jgi:hypothetical protein
MGFATAHDASQAAISAIAAALSLSNLVALFVAALSAAFFALYRPKVLRQIGHISNTN